MSSNTGANSQKLYGLDHLRALAIAQVFLFHYFILSGGKPAWLPELASFGWTGVDLFFVLSGFLIASQLFSRINAGGTFSLKEFYLKRFFRIIPAYLATVSLYFCFPLFREKEALPELWKFLTLTQNFSLNLRDFGTFSHAWSLCVEEHFYLFLPLILLFLLYTGSFKKSWWLLVVIFLSGLMVRAYCFQYLFLPHNEESGSWVEWYKQVYYPTYNRLDGLLTGVLIAALYQFRPRLWLKMSKYGNLLIAVGFLILTGAYFLCADQQSFPASVFGFPVVSVGYGFWVAGAVSPSSFLYKWRSKASTLIATLSYSVYLTHKGIIHLTRQFSESLRIDEHILMLLCMITCLAAAYLLHLSIERPALLLRDRLLKLLG